MLLGHIWLTAIEHSIANFKRLDLCTIRDKLRRRRENILESSSLLEPYPGYPEEEAVSDWLDAHPALPRRVFSFRLEGLAYYFAERNVQSIGDWIGPARYRDFVDAVNTETLRSYTERLDLAAVIIPPRDGVLSHSQRVSAAAQLEHSGFQRLGTSDQVDVFVRSR